MVKEAKQSVEQHYRPAEAAKLLALSQTTIYELIKKGKLNPYIKNGHSTVLIPASTINSYLNSKRVG